MEEVVLRGVLLDGTCAGERELSLGMKRSERGNNTMLGFKYLEAFKWERVGRSVIELMSLESGEMVSGSILR